MREGCNGAAATAHNEVDDARAERQRPDANDEPVTDVTPEVAVRGR
jgi:hypothetical protein